MEYTPNILLPQLDPAVRFDPVDPAAAMELSKIENITNELCDLDDDPDADLSEVVVSSSDLTGHDGDVSDTEAENEVHAALTEALKHTEADDDSARITSG